MEPINYGRAMEELLKLFGAIGPMGIFAILLLREVLPYLGKKGGNGATGALPKFGIGCEAKSVSAEHRGVLEDIAENIREQTKTWVEFRNEFRLHVDEDRKTGLWLSQELGDIKATQAVLLDRERRASR